LLLAALLCANLPCRVASMVILQARHFIWQPPVWTSHERIERRCGRIT
jgi:hypothetical protein